MVARARQSGQGKFGCFLWILAFSIGLMAAVKMVPVRIAVGELTDYAAEQAKWAGNRPAEQIQGALVNKARELELPVTKENVVIEKTGGKIRIRMTFSVPIEFPGYTYQWDFDIDRRWDIFII
jgi:hypothetical protein